MRMTDEGAEGNAPRAELGRKSNCRILISDSRLGGGARGALFLHAAAHTFGCFVAVVDDVGPSA